MAEPKTTTYTNLEDAKAACAAENAECQKTGVGKERFVFDITLKGEHQFYVVATLSGKARAIAALALDIKANVAEKKAPTPQKSVVEQIAGMKPDELAKIRALLAQLEQGGADAVTAPETPPVEMPPVEEPAPKKKGRKSAE